MRNLFIQLVFSLFFHVFLIEALNAQTVGTWFPKNNVNGQYSKSYIFSVDDSIYVGNSSQFYLYDRTSNKLFSRSVPGDLIVSVNCSFSINGKGYILANTQGGLKRVFEFSPNLNTWVAKQVFPGSAINGSGSFVVDGKAYIVSGCSGECTGGALNSNLENWEYNPVTNAFIRKENSSFPGGYIVAGPCIGCNAFPGGNTPGQRIHSLNIGRYGYVFFTYNDLYQYDNISNSWLKKPSPNPGLQPFGNWYAAFESNGEIYYFIFGGTGVSSTPTSMKLFKYNPVTEVWTLVRSDNSMTVLNGNSTFEQVPSWWPPRYVSSFSKTTRNDFALDVNGSIFSFTPNDFSIYTSNYIQQTPPCISENANTNFEIEFTALGNYNPDNQFQVQLSDSIGSFQQPQILLSIPTGSSTQYIGNYKTSLPPTIWDTAKNYKLRVISTSPFSDDENWTIVKEKVILAPNPRIINPTGYNSLCTINGITQNSVKLQAARGLGYQYQWIRINGNITQNIGGAVFADLNVSEPGQYYCRITNTIGCITISDTISVQLQVTPVLPTVDLLTLCQGAIGSALASSVDVGNSLVWYGNAATGGAGSSTAPVPSTSTAGIFDYYVSQRNTTTGCESPRAKLTVTVGAAPSAPTVAAASYCVGSTPTALTATASAGNSLVWYGNAATGGTGSATAPIPSTSTEGVFDYYVSQRNTTTGCEGPRAKLTVTVGVAPTAPTVTGVSYCVGTTSTALTATAGSGNSLLWYGNAATGGTGSSTAPVPSTVTAGLFDYYVSQRNTTTGCESPRSKLTVTIDAAPTAPTVAAISYCIGSTATALTATAGSGNSLLWYGNAATGGTGSSTAPVPSTATAVVFDYYVSQRNNTTGCESPRSKLTVTVTATPNKPLITRDNNNNNLVSSANNGNQWYLEGGAISGATGSTFKPVNSGNYSVQVSINGCKSSFSDVYYYLVSGLVSLTSQESITFSPNPVRNKLKIQFTLASTSTVAVKILDYRGAKVFEVQNLKSGEIMNLQNLISGSYILTVYNKTGQLIFSDSFLKD